VPDAVGHQTARSRKEPRAFEQLVFRVHAAGASDLLAVQLDG
jgi:hypothetical protein